MGGAAVPTVSILAINPNSSHAMTAGISAAIAKMKPADRSIAVDIMTGVETCPASINNQADLEASTREMQAALSPNFAVDVDAVLIACFSVHPLVPWVSRSQHANKPELCVTGIFEASIVTALSLLPPLDVACTGEPLPPAPAKWGIVTTGLFWKDHLTDGVRAFLGQPPPPPAKAGVAAVETDEAAFSRFAGVFCSGADAGDFHPPDGHEDEGGRDKSSNDHHVASDDGRELTPLEKLGKATRDLLKSDPRVRVVVLGCAGMAGLEQTVRDACLEVYGEDGKEVLVVDGVRAGVSVLDMMVRSRRLFAA